MPNDTPENRLYWIARAGDERHRLEIKTQNLIRNAVARLPRELGPLISGQQRQIEALTTISSRLGTIDLGTDPDIFSRNLYFQLQLPQPRKDDPDNLGPIGESLRQLATAIAKASRKNIGIKTPDGKDTPCQFARKLIGDQIDILQGKPSVRSTASRMIIDE